METKPIRVLQLFAGLGRGGAETMIMNYYRAIDRNKVQFDFVTRSKKRLAYEDEIESLGGRIYHITDFKPVNYSLLIKQIKEIFDNTSYQVVHGHIIETAFLIYREANLRGIRMIIAHIHSTKYRNIVSYIIKPLIFSYQKRYITDYFACGLAAANIFLDESLKDKTKVFPNAIDASKFRFSNNKRSEVRSKMNWNDKLVLINVASFFVVKNHLFLISVFKEIIKLKSNSLLILVGGHGELEDKIREMVDSLGLHEQVHFLGGRDDIADLLQGADVFLFPSLYEGFGIAILEAEAAGLKIITSMGVPKDVAIIDNAVEFLSLQLSPKQWAMQTIEVTKNVDRKDCYNEIVEAGFDITKNAEWLQNFYLERANQ